MKKELDILQSIAKEVDKKGGKLYGVGGYVRDKFTNMPNKDVDVEIFGISPSELIEILSKYGVVDEVGSAFGIYMIHGIDIDFALPRKEVKGKLLEEELKIYVPEKINETIVNLIHSKYPNYTIEVNENESYTHKDFVVIPNPNLSLEEATMRRDFTMNALMEDMMTGEIIDLWNGKKDIENKLIRHINDETFKEDSLRVLRACQFASRFEFSIHPDTIALCQEIDLKQLPKERLYLELEKALMKSKKPSIALEYMHELNVINQLFPELKALMDCMQEPKHHPEGSVWNHTKLVIDVASRLKEKSSNPIEFMFGALVHDIGKPSTTKIIDGRITSYEHAEVGAEISVGFMKRLTNDKKLIQGVKNFTKNHMRFLALYPNGSDKSIRKLALQTNIHDMRLFAEADYLGRGFLNRTFDNIEEWYEFKMNELGTNEKIVPLVTGKDLIDLGKKPGIEFKELLNQAMNLQLEGLTKNQIINRLLS